MSSHLPKRPEGCSRLRLSRWINERCPEWTTLLTDHEVARLTRRPRCLLSALTWLGRFPQPQRYHGKRLGWRRQDVEQWLAADRTKAPRKVCPMRSHRMKQAPRPRGIAQHAEPNPNGGMFRCRAQRRTRAGPN